MADPFWTILIPTLGRREFKLWRLLSGLFPQLDAAGGAVTVQALWNNGEYPVSWLRQRLIEHARSAYTSFIDDDDEVPGDYVSSILPLLDGVDFIGFNVQIDRGGERLPRTLISLKYDGWQTTPEVFLRDITNVNPVRRGVVMAHADFTRHEGAAGEDMTWAAQLRGHLKTEHYLDRDMYFYHWSMGDSVQSPMVLPWPYRQPGYFRRPRISHPYFSWHPASTGVS